ncbi:MAG: hypothetical protein ACEPOV_03680 [Hyphomicrobiales bacterium]
MDLYIYDSIDIKDHQKFRITDYNPKSKVFLALMDKDVVAFSREGELFRFNRYGQGPEEYQFYNKEPEMNIKFKSDTTIELNSYNYLKEYSISGQFIQSIKIDDAPIYAKREILGRHPVVDSVLIFSGDNTWGEEEYTEPDDKTYFEKTIDNPEFFLLDLKTKQSKAYGYPEKESLVMVNKKSFHEYDPLSYFNKSKSTIDLLTHPGAQIFRYDLNDLPNYEVIKLSPDHFTPPNFIDEDYFTDDYILNMISDLVLNSLYTEFYSSNDTIITVYRPGVKEEILNKELKDRKSDKSYLEVLANHFALYLEYYIDNKKQTADIKIPKYCSVKYIGNKHNIILINHKQELTINNNPIRRFYFAKIKRRVD